MSKNTRTATRQSQGAENTEEIIGVLTAISIVSKRLAKRLALLEQRSKRQGAVSRNARKKRANIYTD